MIMADKTKNKSNTKENQEYPTSTQPGCSSESFIGPQMPVQNVGVLGASSPFQSIGTMSFSQGAMGNMGMMDPSMMMTSHMGFNPFWNLGPMGLPPPPPQPPRLGPSCLKEIITFKSCVLYPRPPGSNFPSSRERPPGCRTIFVGGMPENTTEEMLKEIFVRSGEICSIRMSKKNFAHIRFVFQESVEEALYISGYCIRIKNKEDKPNCGWLHVDYATARDDQYEYECNQRQWARELRHIQKMEEERLRPPSPPRVVAYTELEASILQENLKNDETFIEATKILSTWMERGECNRKSVNSFYSLIQCINSSVRRLTSDKADCEEEIRKMKESFRQKFVNILMQFDQIETIFTTACKQKSWDHFSKAQRKNIDMWCKQMQETKIALQEEFFNEYQDDAMEMSDGEDGEPGEPTEPLPKRKKTELDENLRYENDALKCQVEAYKNEIDMAKQESLNSIEMKDKQIKAFQFALQGMQQQLITCRQQFKDSDKSTSTNGNKTDLEEIFPQQENLIKEKDKQIEALQLALQGIGQADIVDTQNKENELSSKKSVEANKIVQSVEPTNQCVSQYLVDIPSQLATSDQTEISISSTGMVVSERDLKLVGLISCFLNVHPLGASPDYILSYLKQLQIPVKTSEFEELLEKLPFLFKVQLTGCGASIERRWDFIGFRQ